MKIMGTMGKKITQALIEQNKKLAQKPNVIIDTIKNPKLQEAIKDGSLKIPAAEHIKANFLSNIKIK